LFGLGLFLCTAVKSTESSQWDVFETSFKSAKDYINAFTVAEVNVVFSHGATQWIVPAF